MPRERLQERANSSAENLILSDGGSTEQIDNNAFTNPVGPDSMPSSPPPSYQHVLEETRLAALSDNKNSTSVLFSSTRTSFDSISQDSNSDRQLSECTDFTFRTNIIQSDEASQSPNEDLNIENCNKSTERLEVDGISNNEMSEISNCLDYQEPSTSFDASSRQLDEDSLVALALIQLDDENTDRPCTDYEEFEETENRYNRAISTRQQSEIIEVANKRSKEMYAALAKELGLSCRMSEQCRCADCQGGYLHCEDAEGESGTDGGLGAGTPMFVSEVFGHGTPPACCIL